MAGLNLKITQFVQGQVLSIYALPELPCKWDNYGTFTKLLERPVGLVGLLMDVYLTEVAEFYSNSAKHRITNSF